MILASIVGIFLVSLVLGIPVVFSILLASGIPIIVEPAISLGQVASIILQKLRSFPLLAIPLYIYVGKLLSIGGITDDLVYVSKVLIGKLRGALAHVNVVTSIFFAGISGSTVADVASVGTVLIPAMKKRGYSAEFSATLTGASATIGTIIPPSILMIVYGALAQTSIAGLFLGGIVPGVLIGLVQMVYSYYYAVSHEIGYNELQENFDASDVKKAIIKSIFPLSIFIIVIGGIVGGIFTPTEAAAVTVVYVWVVLYFLYGQRDINSYLEVTKDAAQSASTIFFIIACASFLSWVLTYYQVMIPIIEFIKTSNMGASTFLLVLMLLYTLLGTFMEPASAMLIFVPLLLPVVELLQINPIVVGIVTVMSIRVGTITPPYGLGALVAADIAETSVIKMFKYIGAFLLFYLLVIVIIIYFQDIILFLPNIFLN